MNAFSRFFRRRILQSPNFLAQRPADSRHRTRRLEAAERLEQRKLTAITSVDFRSPGDFFIDASKGPLVNSQYASYKINFDGTDIYDDVWVKVEVPSSPTPFVNLGQYEDGLYHVGRLEGPGAGSTRYAMAYIYFTATGTTNVPQKHTVSVYDGKPGDPSVPSRLILPAQTCTYSNVYDVISANDSKITSAFLSVQPPEQMPLGATMTMTVLGQLGQADNVLFTPACRADWNADAYVLESTHFTIDNVIQPADQIFFTGLAGGSTQQQTRAVYTFRIEDITEKTISEPTQFTQKGNSRYKNDETTPTVTFPSTYNPTSVVKLVSSNTQTTPTQTSPAAPLIVPDTNATVTFTLRFTNTSSRTIRLDAIQDILPTLPAGMSITNVFGTATYTNGTVTFPLSAPVTTVSGSTLTWYNPGGTTPFLINASSYADLTFNVVMPTVTGIYENGSVGKIGTLTIDTTPVPVTDFSPAFAYVAVRKVADLSITKTTKSGAAVAGEVLNYTLTVTNFGPSNVDSVSVTDYFSSDFATVSWTAYYPGTNQVFASSTGNISSVFSLNQTTQQTAIFAITGLVSPSTTSTKILNTAFVSGDVYDPTQTNNSASVENDCTRQGDLSITKTGSPNTVVAGEILTYTLTVTNVGSSWAT
ncbi:MAG: hypothetical protein ACKOYJ_06205, partial [Planctomycetia bacterium]